MFYAFPLNNKNFFIIDVTVDCHNDHLRYLQWKNKVSIMTTFGLQGPRHHISSVHSSSHWRSYTHVTSKYLTISQHVID